MKEEQWITDINDRIDTEVDLTIYTLRELARNNDIEVDYILERYRDKLVYKVNKTLK